MDWTVRVDTRRKFLFSLKLAEMYGTSTNCKWSFYYTNTVVNILSGFSTSYKIYHGWVYYIPFLNQFDFHINVDTKQIIVYELEC